MNIKKIEIVYKIGDILEEKKAYVICEDGGFTFCHKIEDEQEIKKNLDLFVNQTKSGLHKSESYINILRKLEANGDIDYIYLNTSKYEKYQPQYEFNKVSIWRPDYSFHREKIINVGKSRIKIKPLLLALLVAGTVSLSLVTIQGKDRSKRVKIIEPFNYDGQTEERLINCVFENYTSGQSISYVDMRNFLDVITTIYNNNFGKWKNCALLSDHSGVIFRFSRYYEENSSDRMVLEHYEQKYNELIELYVNSSDPKNSYAIFTKKMTSLCSEMYYYIIKDEGIGDNQLYKFDSLKPLTNYILCVMYFNCLDKINFTQAERKVGDVSETTNVNKHSIISNLISKLQMYNSILMEPKKTR